MTCAKLSAKKTFCPIPDELLVYECDGLPQHKHLPRAVVFPNSTEETVRRLCVCWHDEGVSFAPRGAGTGLSGGALAINRGVVIELARMRKILKVDPENRLAQVQTGLVNAQLSRAVAPYGLYYVPDPSSQPVVHHRRQHCRKRRRHSLPEVRNDDGSRRGRACCPGRRVRSLISAGKSRRLRSAWCVCRLRRHVRNCH